MVQRRGLRAARRPCTQGRRRACLRCRVGAGGLSSRNWPWCAVLRRTQTVQPHSLPDAPSVPGPCPAHAIAFGGPVTSVSSGLL